MPLKMLYISGSLTSLSRCGKPHCIPVLSQLCTASSPHSNTSRISTFHPRIWPRNQLPMTGPPWTISGLRYIYKKNTNFYRLGLSFFMCLLNHVQNYEAQNFREGSKHVRSDIVGLRALQKPLVYLGLFNCDNASHFAEIPAKHISGDANEDQVGFLMNYEK